MELEIQGNKKLTTLIEEATETINLLNEFNTTDGIFLSFSLSLSLFLSLIINFYFFCRMEFNS